MPPISTILQPRFHFSSSLLYLTRPGKVCLCSPIPTPIPTALGDILIQPDGPVTAPVSVCVAPSTFSLTLNCWDARAVFSLKPLGERNYTQHTVIPNSIMFTPDSLSSGRNYSSNSP